MQACDLVFQGTKEEGRLCTRNDECASHVCEPEMDHSTRWSCRLPAKEGQPCVGHWECAGPFDCRLNPDRSKPGACVPKKGVGEACQSLFECLSDSCVDGHCAASAQSLESCRTP
jgi:hypothetical protein